MNFEERLGRLERQIGFWKRSAVVMGSLLLCVVAMGQAPRLGEPGPGDRHESLKSLSVNQLTLRDQDGKVSLVMTGTGPGIVTLSHPDSKGTIGLAISTDATRIHVKGNSGMTIDAIATESEAHLGVRGEDFKRPRVDLFAKRAGEGVPVTAAIALTDRNGQFVWTQGAK